MTRKRSGTDGERKQGAAWLGTPPPRTLEVDVATAPHGLQPSADFTAPPGSSRREAGGELSSFYSEELSSGLDLSYIEDGEELEPKSRSLPHPPNLSEDENHPMCLLIPGF